MSGTSSIKGSRYEWNAWKFLNACPGKYGHFRSKSIGGNSAQWKNESYGPIRFDQKWMYFAGKVFENFWAFHSYLDPFMLDVPLISGPHLDKFSTLTWTPSCWMFHSYLDPYGTYVPLIPWPHHCKCSIHTWTPLYTVILEPLLIKLNFWNKSKFRAWSNKCNNKWILFWFYVQ